MVVQSVNQATCRFVPPGGGEVIRIFDEEFKVKVTGEDTGHTYAVLSGSIAPGGGPPLHAHPANETFYVLSGEVEFTQRTADGPSVFRAGPGGVAHAPAGVPHRFENVSPVRSSLLMTVASEMLDFLRELGSAFPPGSEPNMEKMLEIHSRYRVDTFHGGSGSRVEPDQDGATSARARSLAWQFAHEADRLMGTLDGCTDEQWRAVCHDTGWSVGIQAHHIAANLPIIAGVILDAAHGQPHPPMPTEKLDEINARHAVLFANITREEVIELLRRHVPSASAGYRALTDEALDRTTVLSPGGQSKSVADLIEWLAIGEINRHGDAIRAAAGV